MREKPGKNHKRLRLKKSGKRLNKNSSTEQCNSSELSPSDDSRCGITLEVQPTERGAKRVVIARHAGKEVYRDSINTNSMAARQSLIRTLSKQFSLTDKDERWIDLELTREADKNDASYLAAQSDDKASEIRLTQSAILNLVADAEFIRAPAGETYITVEKNGCPHTILVDSRSFGQWLKTESYEKYRRMPSDSMIADAQSLIALKAETIGQQLEVNVRVASRNNAIYLDTGRTEGKIHFTTAKRISFLLPKKVRFMRPRAFQPLPEPQFNGSLSRLFELLNLRDESSKILLAGTLVGMLNPALPQPILLIYGPQGSAKSTATRLIKRLIDPVTPLTRGQPRDERDLVIAARRHWLLAFDNLSSFPSWLSDCLCRLSSGLGFGTRQLHTDNDEVTFEGRRPVIINGISEVATRSDLLDRSVVLNLSPIAPTQRKTESEINEAFSSCHGEVLGCLITGVQTALRGLPQMRMPAQGLPRMADFTTFAMAAMPAFGWKPEEFLEAFMRNRETSSQIALEASVIVGPLKKMIAARSGKTEWITTAAKLLRALDRSFPYSVRRPWAWPKSPAALSRELRELQPALAADGINVAFLHSGVRRIVITSRQQS